MSATKTKNIIFFSNSLEKKNQEIELVRKIKELPFTSLIIFDGSSEKVEFIIWSDLKEPLHDFLINHLNKQKEAIFKKISNELSQ